MKIPSSILLYALSPSLVPVLVSVLAQPHSPGTLLVLGSCIVGVWCVQLCAEDGFRDSWPRGHSEDFWMTTSLWSALVPHHPYHLRADPIVNLRTDVTSLFSAGGSHVVLPWALAPEFWGWWPGGLSGGHTGNTLFSFASGCT